MPTYYNVEYPDQVALTNYLTYKDGNAKKYYFEPNPYLADEEYIADRNSINSVSNNKFSDFYFTLIRNAADLSASITNAETGEVYFEKDFGEADSSYYHINQGVWMNTRFGAKLYWSITDANGEPLPEDTKVNITLTAIPSY